MRRLSCLFVALAVALCGVAMPSGVATGGPALSELPDLSYTRLLRRVKLTLLGDHPTPEELQAMLDAPDDDAREALLQAHIDGWLDSPAFYEAMVQFGHEYVGVGRYDHDVSSSFMQGQAMVLTACGDDTLHAGRWGILHNTPQLGDPLALCDDPDALTHEVEPWWAPGTTVGTIGWAGAGYQSLPDGRDCAVANLGFGWILKGDNPDPDVTPRCGCGPNLIYCARRGLTLSGNGMGSEGFDNDPTGQQRSLFEEPARLFAHIITQDRPFTDLVLGDYTVVNQGLQHLYVRHARQSGRHAELDDDPWWQAIDDPDAWREVTVADMNPFFTAARFATFDPRLDYGEPPPMPSAGVLTTLGSLGSFQRERPRAARWLESLACRQFVPPPATVAFPPFQHDPGTEGACVACHQVLDPAAIHFKRFSASGMRLGGYEPWRWNQLVSYDNDRVRWAGQFAADTLMTPVTPEDMALNDDTRFLDFLPPDQALLGQVSDGTFGPLGFAKLIVDSGEMDRCTVRRFYQRFGGQTLDPEAHKPFIDALVAEFLAQGRQIRPLIRHILALPISRKGF